MDTMRLLFAVILLVDLLDPVSEAGPYPGSASQPGTTAIHMDDPAIIAWADGYMDYHVGSNCDSTWQTPLLALGKAAGTAFDVVSLGRGGQITLFFYNGIGDRQGFDFLIFENSVNDTFLELAFVEVSSDGEHFFRFENNSLTTNPVPSYGAVDPTNITGLAGKYRQGYGTPFDLNELKGISPLLDVTRVKYVRIVDIIGDGTYRDTSGDIIYDPYPTIGSAGFDLDAIGVFNSCNADWDENAIVDLIDLMTFANAWLAQPGDPNWDSRCDISYDRDNLIDLRDFAVFSKQWLIEPAPE